MGSNEALPLSQRQNAPGSLRLLAAQRQLYGRAKIYQMIRLAGAIVLEAVAPIILIVDAKADIVMGVIGGGWFLLSWLLLERTEDDNIRQGARIQEQFDTELFGLPWNGTLVGHPVAPEIVVSAASDFHGDPERLKDWYPDLDRLPYPLNVINLQRANLVWDSRLRRHYASRMTALTVTLFVAGAIVSLVTDQSLRIYILAVFFPSLAALHEGWKLAGDHRQVADDQERIEREIRQYADHDADADQVTLDDCRRVQDSIYINRRRGSLVPDWYYWLLRTRFERDMSTTAADLQP